MRAYAQLSPREFAAGDLIKPRTSTLALHALGEILADTSGLTTPVCATIAYSEIGIVIGTREVMSMGRKERMHDVMFRRCEVGSVWPHDLDIIVQARPR